MLWIKRNLYLLIGILVAVGLTVLAVFYLISRMSRDEELTKKLEEQTAELQRVMAVEPYPNDSNIAAVNKEIARLRQLAGSLQHLLVETNPPVLNNAQFSSLIAVTISDLQTNAENAGVTLPPKYGFTFAGLREKVQFAPVGIPLLTTQVSEIRELCDILFRSKIHVLEGLRRVPVSPDDAGSAADYLDTKGIVTNKALNVTITPYEVTFRGFTMELASVVEGLQHAQTYFVIKGVAVDTMEVPPPPPPPPDTKPAAPGKATGKNSVTNAPKTDLTLVLDEKPLRVRLSIEVVKPIPKPAAAAKK